MIQEVAVGPSASWWIFEALRAISAYAHSYSHSWQIASNKQNIQMVSRPYESEYVVSDRSSK